MNGVNAIEDGDAGRLLCCFVLDAADELVPFLRGVGMSNTVQNAAHAEVDEDVVQLLGVESMRLLKLFGPTDADRFEGELGHLSRLVLNGQGAEYAVDEGVLGGHWVGVRRHSTPGHEQAGKARQQYRVANRGCHAACYEVASVRNTLTPRKARGMNIPSR